MDAIFSPATLTLTAFALLSLRIVFRAVRPIKGRPVPPGPKSLPLLGNVHQLPAEYQERTFLEWGRTYGPVIFAKMFQTPVVIINSFEVARDLLDKRSQNYSGRPVFTLLTDLLGWEDHPALLPYGTAWKTQRKWIQDSCSKLSLRKYHSLLRKRSCLLLSDIISFPEMLGDHFARYSAATILEITYGHQVTHRDDDFVRMASQAVVDSALAARAGGVIVDFFPFLKYYPGWLPGSGFKREALKTRILVRRAIEEPHQKVKEEMALGVARSSITSNLLEGAYGSGSLSEEEKLIKGAASAMFSDKLIGDDIYFGNESSEAIVFRKLTTESLPYLNALITELYRYNPPFPLGIPHATSKDDDHKGYFIPKNSMVLVNIWAMSCDEGTYPEPEVFRPERFLNLTKSEMDAIDPRNFVFGFGRRLCPGRWLAEDSVFLLTSRIVSTMNISKAQDENGEDITPAYEFTSGITSRPKPFPFSIVPRSQKAADIISRGALES